MKSTSTGRALRVFTVIPAAVAVVVLVAGCTAPVDPVRASTGSPTPAAGAAKTIEMPDLGPSPAPSVLSEEELERLRLAQQDVGWQRVSFMHPAAERPSVVFEGYTGDDDYLDTLHACLVENGVNLGVKVNEVGEEEPTAASPTDEPGAIADFVCRSTVVVKPSPWNAAQIGYHYDYLTRFLVPCYAANGIENKPAPSREEYISLWPNPGWAPELGDAFGTPAAAPLVEACPHPFD
jgi:hypothetical protein